MVFEFIKKVLLETFQFFLYLLVVASEVIGTCMAVLIHLEKPILCLQARGQQSNCSYEKGFIS